MQVWFAVWWYISLILIKICTGLSSPLQTFTKYDHSVKLQENVADLWWTVNNIEKEIMFELHIKTTGWIALGISPAGGMQGADIAVGWVDSSSKVHIQDRSAFGKIKPVIDNTTQDWFALKGKEQNGWTALQFKRYFDTCDPMDVPIKSGTNILIFAYGLVDPDSHSESTDITYHEDRKGTRMLPLRSYTDQPSDGMLTGLDYVDFRFNNHVVPPDDTTYYCKVFKSPGSFNAKRHAIAHEVLIDPRNVDLLHHLDLFECTSKDVINDAELPDGICDDILNGTRMCSANIATSWAIGADPTIMYPEEAGYSVTSDTGSKYFMIKVHYDNPRLTSNRRDSSGIRFYLSKELRRHDLGYMLFGAASSPASLAIPPQVKQFAVDSYCPPEATQSIPISGVTVVSALPHTHLQGHGVWTKIIRNNTAVQYLFNAEAFNFNYQFANRLSTPIKIYPGDAFVTRCIYTTMNKTEITLGGQRTSDEMCSNTFAYYPLVDSLSACITVIHESGWQNIMNTSEPIDNIKLEQWLHNLTWTPGLKTQWQEFYDKAPRVILHFTGSKPQSTVIPAIPKYQDLQVEPCKRGEIQSSTDRPHGVSNSESPSRYILLFFLLLSCIFKTFYCK